MTSDSEIFDNSATKVANNATNTTNQTQPMATAQNQSNDNDTTDGSIASIADQIDETIDEIIEEAIEVDNDSRTSQFDLMGVDNEMNQQDKIRCALSEQNFPYFEVRILN